MSRPSRHFTWHELGHPPLAHRRRTRHLATHLERLRALTGGKKLQVVGGYRSAKRNRAVGGARFSQHRRGAAADIPAGYATTRQAIAAGFTGIGSVGPWAIHVDVRRGRLTQWAY